MHNTINTIGLTTTITLALMALSACSTAPPITVLPHEAAQPQLTKLVGEGRLSHAPDFVELEITITSQCYATPIEAVKATDEAVATVIKLLKAKTDPDNPRDGVFSHGGYTQPYERYISSRRQTVCRNTFQKSSTVTMKTSRLDTFAKEFADIQNIIFTTMSGPTDPEKAEGVTFATTGTPQTQLYYETREELEQKALADALDNARLKFDATANAACKDTAHRIVKFVETRPEAGRPIAYGFGGSDGGGDEGGAIGFDAIWINKVLDVYFLIDSPCKSS